MKDIYKEKIGNILKAKREEKNLDIQEISRCLKINPTYISALEEGDIEKVPALVFFKGFLKNYGNFLGLRGEDLVVLLSKEVLKEKIDKNSLIEESHAKTDGKKDAKKLAVIGFIFFIIIFSWARVSHINYKRNAEIEKRRANNFNALTTAKEMALHEEKKKILNGANNTSKEDLIVVKVNEDSWVEVIFDNTKIFQGLLLKGDKRDFPYKKGMKVKLGNAGGVELIVRGVEKKGLGKDGEVKEIILD